MIYWQLLKKPEVPLFGDKWHYPDPSATPDLRLVVGSIIFGKFLIVSINLNLSERSWMECWRFLSWPFNSRIIVWLIVYLVANLTT